MKNAILVAGLALALAGCDNKKPEPTDLPTPEPAKIESTAKPKASEEAEDRHQGGDMPMPTVPTIPAPPDVAAAPADAQKTASGLRSKLLSKGTGKDHPSANERVKVNYTGWTKDGKMFDSSVTTGKPITFGVGEVIKGWNEGLQLMVVGEKRRFWIPGDLAYGLHPQMVGAPAGDLVFDVELLEIFKPGKAPPAPPDVKEAPKDATKLPSGLAYKLIKKGTGKDKPGPESEVSVNYTGWTTDGKMFDSSFTSGEPVSFPLNHVIKGWTEGLQLMHVGDTMRFWIPKDMAYGDHPRAGAPAGNLVFDVELLEIGK